MQELKLSPEEKDNPLVSFLIVTYNQERFVEESIQAAMDQTYAPLEIIISDDCSTDATFEVINSVVARYKGPHKVAARREDSNKGIGVHLSRALSECQGDFIVFAAGDDISHRSRTEYAIKEMCRGEHNSDKKSISALTTEMEFIDRYGNLHPQGGKADVVEEIDVKVMSLDHLVEGRFHTRGSTRIITKEVYKYFGDVAEDCYAEDMVYMLRTLLIGDVVHSRFRSVKYRQHANNFSKPKKMHVMSFSPVARQMKADLEKARLGGFVDDVKYKRVLGFIDAASAYRNYQASQIDKRRLSFQDIKHLLAAPQLMRRQKLSILKYALKQRILN